jgi:hypothetical protein
MTAMFIAQLADQQKNKLKTAFSDSPSQSFQPSPMLGSIEQPQTATAQQPSMGRQIGAGALQGFVNGQGIGGIAYGALRPLAQAGINKLMKTGNTTPNALQAPMFFQPQQEQSHFYQALMRQMQAKGG